MHEEIETKCFLRRARFSHKAVNQNECASERTITRRTIRSAIETEGFRRRGSDAFVANLFFAGGLLFDVRFLLVHAPWKILIPHSTTTMADTSVAAVNTLSKEATLIPLSPSHPRLTV